MLEINGLKYSKEKFDDYKIRATFELCTGVTKTLIDVYTTDLDKENVLNVVSSRKSNIVQKLKIVQFVIKEYDDACAVMIDEWLSEAT